MEIDVMEYIIGFIAIVVIIIYYIGMVVWQDTITRRFQKIIKTAEINNKEIHESDLLILKQTVFPDGNDNDIENIYNTISAGGIQEIESIKVYEGKYFVKMRFYGEGYFTLEGTHVDIVSVGHVINMKNGQLLYTPQNDDTEYISMTQKDY
ncbi:hypothetical protein [Dialister invisus]|uniref:hypothetical protein n=1 Tax=Dialister invisus TaxID=218538 RepID=UPI00267474AD|nr:hypothetical protein [Dialister invisus]